jgi:hypothetical protein
MPSGESDEPWGMPFSLQKPSGRVLHVAFKHLREPFEFGQPEGYPLRAACIARTHNQRSALNPPADWANGDIRRSDFSPDPRLSNFQRVITHAEASRMIRGYTR